VVEVYILHREGEIEGAREKNFAERSRSLEENLWSELKQEDVGLWKDFGRTRKLVD